MHKEVYILGSIPSEDYKIFRNRIFKLSEKVLDRFGPETLKICLTLKAPPRISIIPFKKKKIAVISIRREEAHPVELIFGSEGYIGSYKVEEALPVSYSKTWNDGEPTPGECLLTLFHRKLSIDQETFIRRWHEGHTPLSLKLHPLWNYNRNVVKSVLTEDSVWYDGIVEEQFQKPSDLLNPIVFFGPLHKVPIHMVQVWMDTMSFIDMRRIETYLATEIHLKS
jgi:hypothetical protein